MSADYAEIVTDKGTDYDLAINFDGTINRTGYSWAGQVREVASATGTAEATFTFDSTGLPRTLFAKLSAAVTATLNPLKRYRFDIVETDAGGLKDVLVQGTFRVRTVVTK